MYKLINERYSYFSDNKSTIIVDRFYGYINATHLCKSAGKEYDDWLNKGNGRELIAHLEEISSTEDVVSPFYVREADDGYEGTYVNDRIISYILCWLPYDFSDKLVGLFKHYRYHTTFNVLRDEFAKNIKEFEERAKKAEEMVKEVEEKYIAKIKVIEYIVRNITESHKERLRERKECEDNKP